jgi:hypothetical protein
MFYVRIVVKLVVRPEQLLVGCNILHACRSWRGELNPEEAVAVIAEELMES